MHIYYLRKLLYVGGERENMDSNMAGFLFNATTLESMYHQAKKDDGFIDLGLSLKTLHPQACHGHTIDQATQNLHLDSAIVPGSYSDFIEWPYLNPVRIRSPNTGCSRTNQQDCGEDSEGVQSKERWAYVKVNMDGVVVGRKISLVNVAGYSNLAFQLEDMFGRLSASGLRLFQAGSEFILFYKDGEENWRAAGDVPWKEFVHCVKRIRIVRKNKALLS